MNDNECTKCKDDRAELNSSKLCICNCGVGLFRDYQSYDGMCQNCAGDCTWCYGNKPEECLTRVHVKPECPRCE